MKHKFYYGTSYEFTDKDKSVVSQKGYECKAVMRDRKQRPMAILQSTDANMPMWKVMYGFSRGSFFNQ